MMDSITGKERKVRIALDFDGVLHSYVNGYTGPIPLDNPVRGAQIFCKMLLERGYEIVIFTTRVHPELDNTHKFVEIVDRVSIGETDGRTEWRSRENKGLTLGEEAIRQWLKHWEFPKEMHECRITHKKEHADLFVDDRAFRFKGNFGDVVRFLEDNPECKTWLGMQ